MPRGLRGLRPAKDMLSSPAAAMSVARLVIAGMGLLATPLYTRVLPPAEYGTLVLSVAAVSLGGSIPTQWVQAAILRFGGRTDAGVLHATTMRSLAYTAPVVVIVTVAVAIATLEASPQLVALCATLALSESLFAARWVSTRARVQWRQFAVAGFLRNGVSLLILVVLAAASWTITVEVVLSALIVGSLTGAAVTWNSLPRRRGGECDSGAWWRYGRPLILNFAFGLGLLYVDRFMLLLLEGRAEVGLYSATFDLLYSVTVLMMALVGLTSVPAIFSAENAGLRRQLLQKLRKNALRTAIALVVVVYLAWGPISRLLIGPSLRLDDPILVLTLLVAFVLTGFRQQYVSIVAQVRHRTVMHTWITASALGVNVVANAILIPLLGLRGAAVATLLSALAGVSLGTVDNRRDAKKMALESRWRGNSQEHVESEN